MLLVPLGLLAPGSAALAAETEPEPEPSVSVSVPAEDPDEGDGEDGGEELPEILSGAFTRTPATGPAGTELKLASKDACVDGEGVVGPTVDVLLFNLGNEDDFDDLGSLSKIAKAAADEAE